MAKDKFHDAVRRALEKEGWIITDDPYSFSVGNVDFRIDLGAEKLIAAEKSGEKIVVEIKSFIRQSPVTAPHEAVGKYDLYLLGLEEHDPERLLFLAIPNFSFDNFFQRPFVQKVIERKNLKLIIYDTEQEIIVQWIK